MRTIQRALMAFLAVAAPAAFASSVAFITNLKGEVTLDGGARPAVLSELSRGQKLALGKDALASVMYIASGKEYVLRGPGDYLVKDTEVSASSGVPPVTRTTEWRPSNKALAQVAQSSAASVRMRSIPPPKPDPGKLQFPTQGVITTLQPTFRWAPPEVKGPVDFWLALLGDDKPVASAKIGGASHRISVKLKPDTEYMWAVAAAGKEIGTARFRTLPAESLQRIEQRRPADKAEFSDRLLYALLLQELGATQEAHESWAKLAAERADLPELSTLAK